MATTFVPDIGSSPIDASLVYPGMAAGVDGNTPRPYTLDQMDADNGLLKDTIEDSARILNTLNDVLEMGMTDVEITYANESVTLPDSISMRITSGGAHPTATYPVVDALPGGVLAGTDVDLMGNEMGQRLRYISAYYNEMKAGVSTEQYGVKFNQVDMFKLYDKAVNQLAKLYAETKGRAKREALTQWFNRENVAAGSGAPGQHLNPNWIIANSTAAVTDEVDGNGMPIYDADVTGFGVHIDTAMDAAATGTNGADANISIVALDRISQICSDKYFEKIDGKLTVIIPQPQWYKLSSLGTDQMGAIWRDVSQYAKDEARFPGEIGTYRDLRIVADERWVSMVQAGAGSMTFEYLEPGGVIGDNREKALYDAATNKAWQLGWVLGKSAFIERMEKDLFYKEVEQEYGKRKGIGAFMEAGWNLTLIRTDAVSSGFPTYVENRNSAVLAFTPPKL